jgi:ABC-type bacteriocin/lantibiotic exporter with double-glycine peptidase domain
VRNHFLSLFPSPQYYRPFRNITFRYPGSKRDRAAISNVSFDIPASSMVVIVGENGSGKSTLVKLLTQLYPPTSGSILIDSMNVSVYHLDDLYAAMALLAQDHTIFPLTIAENIGVGDASAVDDMTKIQLAAKLGGVADFVENMACGYMEVLHPVMTGRACRYPLPEGPLKSFSDKIEGVRGVSGT